MYVDAFIDREHDEIVVIERIDNERIIRREPIDYSFYVKDKNGGFRSIFGDPLRKIPIDNRKDFYMTRKKYNKEDIFESDVNRVHKFLSENYGEEDIPEPHIGYIDIEVGFTPENKYSNSDLAENPIISVSVTNGQTGETHILALPPSTLTFDESVEIINQVTDKGEIYACEPELINRFMELIQPYDILSGWNSKMYDFKYIINRIFNITDPNVARHLSICGMEPQKKTQWNTKIKREEEYYDLVGRVHLDYQELYKKYTYSELSSYSLDNVSYVELDERKVEYSGTLDQLYKNDFKKFIEYNIQDTELIYRLENKLKFINTTNIRSHQNGVVMNAAMGTVGIVEQAIINEAHRYYNEIVFDKPEKNENETGAAGAFVVTPKKGLKRYVSGNDINSLYPSVLRTLNASPETIVAQVLSHRTDEHILNLLRTNKVETVAEAWHSFFGTFEYDDVINKSDTIVQLEINETKEILDVPAYKVYEMVFSGDQYSLSANGTIFSRVRQGIIPHLLERWYSDRKKMQAKAEEWEGKMYSLTGDERKVAEYWYKYWDQRQLAKKIDLNSLYGALLNKHCRFYDKRLGQTTTLTGRSITRHMAAKINEIITGEYDYTGKSIIYGDTDSVSSNTKVITDGKEEEIEKLFLNNVKDDGDVYYFDGSEYIFPEGITGMTYNPESGENDEQEVDYIYRHKVNKEMYEIEDEYGNVVEVTGDHSIMVERDGDLISVTPPEAQENDYVISI